MTKVENKLKALLMWGFIFTLVGFLGIVLSFVFILIVKITSIFPAITGVLATIMCIFGLILFSIHKTLNKIYTDYLNAKRYLK